MNCIMQNNNQCTNNKKNRTFFVFTHLQKNKNKTTIIAFITAVRTKIPEKLF